MVFFARLLKSSALAAWGIFFAWLLIWGQDDLIRLLNPNLWWLVIGGATLLLFLSFASLFRSSHTHRQQPFVVTLCQTALVVLPLVFFPLAREGRFGSMALEKRGIIPNTSKMAVPYPPLLEDRQKEEENGEISLMSLFRNTNKYEGKTIRISGMVFRNEKLPENVFMCYRFLMTCCAADAAPVFTMVEYNKAKELQKDSWVQIQGVFTMIEKEGMPIPTIKAEEVHEIEEPAIPFLF